MSKQKLIVILGPTSSGKSDLAVAIAKKIHGEIISADSRQVYKGLDIGTGKITKREMRGVPHHVLDVADPKRVFSVVRYKTLANRAIRSIIKKGRVPILVGGTGFYIDAVVKNFSLPAVPANAVLRAQLKKKTAGELFALLKKKDPRRASMIDPKNPHRLIRALEIADALGAVPTLQKEDTPYDPLLIGLTLPAATLRKKIYERLLIRLKKGMVAEAKRLHKNGLSYKRMRELGLEYRFLADFLEKKISKEECITNLASAIVHYARRQMTWFRRDLSIHWHSPKDRKAIEKEIRLFLS